jgi:hypothetical protein
MNVPNLLVDLNSVILIFLVVNAFKPFIGSYSAKKGENLATKEDIAQLTKIAEGIKAEISDVVWDRQKQWEMKRDAILEGIRAHADLEAALVNLNTCFSGCLTASTKERADETSAKLSAAAQGFRSSRTSFMCAYHIADLAVGGQFSNAMSVYFRLTGDASTKMTHNRSVLGSAEYKELELSGKNVILSARQALGINDAGDLAQFDNSN